MTWLAILAVVALHMLVRRLRNRRQSASSSLMSKAWLREQNR